MGIKKRFTWADVTGPTRNITTQIQEGDSGWVPEIRLEKSR